jgi:hypothetical protein
MKENTIFYFLKKYQQKKNRPKIYIIALDIFFYFLFFLIGQKKLSL